MTDDEAEDGDSVTNEGVADEEEDPDRE